MVLQRLFLPPLAHRPSLPHAALRLDFPQAAPVQALLSLREAGDMRFRDNYYNERRAAFLGAHGLDPVAVRATELHHSRRVLVLGGEGPARFGPPCPGAPEAVQDGLILGPDSPGGVSVTVADCMPIWLYDHGSGALGILHSGWKGTGILAVALHALATRFGTKAASVSAILGPAIGTCCYPVPAERARGFAAEFGAAAVLWEEGQPRLDLRAANLALAESLGLGAVASLEACTSCDLGLGSYRREGQDSFTRMLAYCGPLPPDAPRGLSVVSHEVA